MSIELPPELYRLADIGEWERLIGRKALEVVRYGNPQAVLDLVRERAERTPESPLFAIEARALLDLQAPAQAELLLDRAFGTFPALGNPGRLAEILWLRAQAAADEGEPASSLAFLRRLAEVTAPMPSALAHVQALTEILGLLNPDDEADARAAEVGPVRHRLSEALVRLTGSEVSAERSLVRLALVRLGPHYPQRVAELAPLTAFDLVYLAERGMIDLSSAVEPIVAGLSAESEQPQRQWPTDVGGLIDELVHALERQPGSEHVIAAVLALLRAEGASLSGASLAGLDDYREPWELEVIREVAS